MQIENERYVRAFFVLPLLSGRIAVLGPRHDLLAVVETWDEAKAAGLKYGATVPKRAVPKINLGGLRL